MRHFIRLFVIPLALSGVLLLTGCSSSGYSSGHDDVYGGYGYPYYGYGGHYYDNDDVDDYLDARQDRRQAGQERRQERRENRPDRPGTQREAVAAAEVAVARFGLEMFGGYGLHLRSDPGFRYPAPGQRSTGSQADQGSGSNHPDRDATGESCPGY